MLKVKGVGMHDSGMSFALARAATQRAILDRAALDTDFRTLLAREPHVALAAVLGVDLVPRLAIKVIEEQPGELVLVLPQDLSPDCVELPEELLDCVSGGGKPDALGNTWKWDSSGYPYRVDICGVEHHDGFSRPNK